MFGTKGGIPWGGKVVLATANARNRGQKKKWGTAGANGSVVDGGDGRREKRERNGNGVKMKREHLIDSSRKMG